jgi:predicted MPP superfamily phosphohydrolase
MAVEPIPGEPAAVAGLPGERALVLADYHAGLEVGLRSDGVELRSHAADRRESVLGLLSETAADRLIVLGDLGNAIGEPGSEERSEVEDLLGAVTERVPVTVVKGNHDGEIEAVTEPVDGDVTVTVSGSVTWGSLTDTPGPRPTYSTPTWSVRATNTLSSGWKTTLVALVPSVSGCAGLWIVTGSKESTTTRPWTANWSCSRRSTT